MASTGKQLEELVAFVEERMLPQGFEVRKNASVRNDDGIQIAEFDIEISGRLGSTEISWLIECRDRPSQGPSPGAWIEQLAGRRTRFGFNKVTAVSTTGFAPGAKEFALQSGIELREVRALTPAHFANWLQLPHLKSIELQHHLIGVTLLVQPDESRIRIHALSEALSGTTTDSPILLSTQTGERVSAMTAFMTVVKDNPSLAEGLLPNQPAKHVEICVTFPSDDSHFAVETSAGNVRIREVLFVGELGIKEVVVPLSQTSEYRCVETGDVISQVASFSFSANNTEMSVEMHRIVDTGQIYVSVRKLGDLDTERQ